MARHNFKSRLLKIKKTIEPKITVLKEPDDPEERYISVITDLAVNDHMSDVLTLHWTITKSGHHGKLRNTTMI